MYITDLYVFFKHVGVKLMTPAEGLMLSPEPSLNNLFRWPLDDALYKIRMLFVIRMVLKSSTYKSI